MRLEQTIEQLSIDEIRKKDFDYVICSSGYETRARYLAEEITPKGKSKFALNFSNYQDLEDRHQNDKVFKSLKYTTIDSVGDSDVTIITLLKSLKFNEKEEYNLLIDYSSMTRIWYSSILNYFRYFEPSKKTKVNLFFSYSIALFVPPPEEIIPNKHVGPIKGFYRMSLPIKPTLLVLGLGYEKIRAYGLTEFLDAETIIFYTDTSDNNKFSMEVENSNAELLKMVSEENIFKYSIKKIGHLHQILNPLCKKLSEKHRIIIAPCGPKPFTLISLVNSILLDEMDVWRISPGIQGLPQDRKPSGDVIVLKMTFHD